MLIYLLNDPKIFDVIKVRVATLVQPSSPVHLHQGSDVQFKIVNEQFTNLESPNVQWSSSDQSVLKINRYDGSAKALREGKAEIMITGSDNAVSIAHVSPVKHVEIEQHDDLILNVDNRNGNLRLRMKLYLKDQVEELMPISRYDGNRLIRQNVVLDCKTDWPELVDATSETRDDEGYFCNIRFRGRRGS